MSEQSFTVYLSCPPLSMGIPPYVIAVHGVTGRGTPIFPTAPGAYSFTRLNNGNYDLYWPAPVGMSRSKPTIEPGTIFVEIQNPQPERERANGEVRQG